MTLRAVKFPEIAGVSTIKPKGLWSALEADGQAVAPIAAAGAQSGYDDGFKAGMSAKTEEVSQALLALERARQEIETRLESLEAQYRQQCAATLAQIINAAAPAICEGTAHAAIARIFNDAAGAGVRADLTLRASPDIVDAISKVCGDGAPGSLVPDADLAPGTLEARWRDGGLNCDVGRSLFAIVEFLNSQSGQVPQERYP